MRRLALVGVVGALLAFPVAAGACDRDPGGLAARATLAVAHPTATPAARPTKHLSRALHYYRYYR